MGLDAAAEALENGPSRLDDGEDGEGVHVGSRAHEGAEGEEQGEEEQEGGSVPGLAGPRDRGQGAGVDLVALLHDLGCSGPEGVPCFVGKLPGLFDLLDAAAKNVGTRFSGRPVAAYQRSQPSLSSSPLGTGTDWWHLLDASAKIGQKWKLITFTPDDPGFEQATARLKTELDAGRPVVVDFKYIGPQYPGGNAGHTLNVCGYIAEQDLYILCNPAVATPGLQLITADDLKNFWRSDHYGALSKGVLSRPAFVIDQP